MSREGCFRQLGGIGAILFTIYICGTDTAPRVTNKIKNGLNPPPPPTLRSDSTCQIVESAAGLNPTNALRSAGDPNSIEDWALITHTPSDPVIWGQQLRPKDEVLKNAVEGDYICTNISPNKGMRNQNRLVAIMKRGNPNRGSVVFHPHHLPRQRI